MIIKSIYTVQSMCTIFFYLYTHVLFQFCYLIIFPSFHAFIYLELYFLWNGCILFLILSHQQNIEYIIQISCYCCFFFFVLRETQLTCMILHNCVVKLNALFQSFHKQKMVQPLFKIYFNFLCLIERFQWITIIIIILIWHKKVIQTCIFRHDHHFFLLSRFFCTRSHF